MKHLIDFKLFESYNDYNVGDIVLIRYSLTGDITQVKIIKKYGKNNFLVSFQTEDSFFVNAKDQEVNIKEIIGPYRELDNFGNRSVSVTQNPAINPRVDDIIAKTNDKTLSNDITAV